MKIALILFGALVFLACPASAQSAAGLKITRCEAVKTFGEPPYLWLDIEYPQDFEKSGEEIRLNGKKTFSTNISGGLGGGMSQKTFLVYVGGPGKKEIEVILNFGGKVLKASQTLDFRSEGDVLWLDHVDDEAIFTPGEFRFFGYFFQDLKIAVNGREMQYHPEPSQISADHFLIRCTPELTPGINAMLLSWKSYDGHPRSRKYNFYLAQDGVVKQGDTLKLALGAVGSKSGPFYQAEIAGNSLAAAGKSQARQVTLQDGVRLGLVEQFVTVIKAKEPGEGTVNINVKPIFWQPFQLDRQIKLTVVK